jgi:hypothetical protein
MHPVLEFVLTYQGCRDKTDQDRYNKILCCYKTAEYKLPSATVQKLQQFLSTLTKGTLAVLDLDRNPNLYATRIDKTSMVDIDYDIMRVWAFNSDC